MRRKLLRTKNGRFCEVEITLENGRLSICGTEGRIVRKVQVTESCGQIRDTIAEFFPEVAPLLPYHLNDMHAGCEHQDALGWGRDKIGAPCPTCGYKYGTAWLKRELPPEIVKLAETVCASE